MRYVVTGATGFIGAEFILTLLNAGNTVYAIGRNETKARTILPVSDSLNFVKAELSEFKDLDSKIPEADVFVNFAWDGITVSGRDMTDVQKYLALNDWLANYCTFSMASIMDNIEAPKPTEPQPSSPEAP